MRSRGPVLNAAPDEHLSLHHCILFYLQNRTKLNTTHSYLTVSNLLRASRNERLRGAAGLGGRWSPRGWKLGESLGLGRGGSKSLLAWTQGLAYQDGTAPQPRPHHFYPLLWVVLDLQKTLDADQLWPGLAASIAP